MTPFGTLAQTIQLTGLVTDAANEPIIGASVVEKGTTNGVITDFDGNFALSVSPKATIIISYVGYATQEVPVNGKTNIRVTLKEDTEMLDEVVVVGYGTMKKSDMTGAISSVDVDDLVKRTTTNPAEALQGKIAGVNIMKLVVMPVQVCRLKSVVSKRLVTINLFISLMVFPVILKM